MFQRHDEAQVLTSGQIKVISHKAASAPQMDGSIIFARFNLVNMTELVLPSAHNVNGKSISSGMFVQLMAQRHCTLQWAALSRLTLPIPTGIWTPI